MSRTILNTVLSTGFLLLAASPAFPIALQYSPTFTTGSGGLSGVVNLGGCSGALLADGLHVITAAHCAASIGTNGVDTFLTPFNNMHAGIFTNTTSVSIPVTAVHLNPLTALWFPSDFANTNLLMYDLAILDLATVAPADATRYNLDLTGDAIVNNSAVTLAGWGLGGYPGGTVGNAGDRRSATNTVAGVFTQATDPNIPATISLPDLPIALAWTTTADINNPSNTTGLGNHGDSGGPLTYNGNLIGVLSFGTLPASGTIAIGQTYLNGYTDLAVAGNADWLLQTLAPEPGTWAMAIGGAIVLALARRRRAVKPF
jgi:hypothetical protein